MTAAADSQRLSLRSRVFTTVLALVLAAVAAFTLAMLLMFYFTYEQDADQRLETMAEQTAASLNARSDEAAMVALLNTQMPDGVRYTLIANDGSVVFDNSADISTVGSHADRPEFISALTEGRAVSLRYSATLHADMLYAAVLLDNGDVVRLAQSQNSLFAFLDAAKIPAVFGIVVLVVLVFIFSRLFTRRIMRPIDALDFSGGAASGVYVEMDPLIERIAHQQKQLKQQNSELAEAENLRREFSANVSHEMKTPLTVIAGYAELMKDGVAKPEDYRKFSGLIYDESLVMRSLINDVLVISRLEEANVAKRYGDEPIDLLAVSRTVARRLQKIADEQHVAIRVSGERALIRGIDTLAEEMIYNLVENGIRYNREGGSVTVDVENVEGTAQVMIEDTGIGIPDELKDKVFERFYRVEKSRSKDTGGTGLGLAIVKHAVQYLEGTIEVHSVVGEGTEFVLRFPQFPASS